MTPETKARQQIDQKLEAAGWVIQDIKQLNLSVGVGVGVGVGGRGQVAGGGWRAKPLKACQARQS
jgi:hypothetical protein